MTFKAWPSSPKTHTLSCQPSHFVYEDTFRNNCVTVYAERVFLHVFMFMIFRVNIFVIWVRLFQRMLCDIVVRLYSKILYELMFQEILADACMFIDCVSLFWEWMLFMLAHTFKRSLSDVASKTICQMPRSHTSFIQLRTQMHSTLRVQIIFMFVTLVHVSSQLVPSWM